MNPEIKITIMVIFSLLGVVSLFLSVNYVFGQTVDNQTDTETRTFEDCFDETMKYMLLALVFSPNTNLDASDIVDPLYKKTAINMCNFLHEKTGKWVGLSTPELSPTISEQYSKEFYQRYGNEIRQELKGYWEK